MNWASKRSKSSVVRSATPHHHGAHVLSGFKWLNPKSIRKPPIDASTLNNNMASLKLSKKFSSFRDQRYCDENQHLIGKKAAAASSSSSSYSSPDDDVVPKGSLAVYVGPELKRFVIPACCLSMPEIMALMDSAAEEFGYHHQGGGIQIPNCDQHDFQFILAKSADLHHKMSKGKAKTKLK